MHRLLLLLAFPAFVSAQIIPSMTTAQIQAALNQAATGSTVTFAAGSYSITSALHIPCNGLQITGPATLNATYNNDAIFDYPANCLSMGSVKYLTFMNTGAVYVPGTVANFDFEYNKNGNMPSGVSGSTNTIPSIGVDFDGGTGATLTNITIKHNTFGDQNSCTAVFATSTDMGGYCAGVLINDLHSTNVAIDSNVFNHVEEGIHFFQVTNYKVGDPTATCVSCEVVGNYILNYHRIAVEIQIQTPVNSFLLAHNAVVDPLNSSYGTFAMSIPCCQWEKVYGTPGFSPGIVHDDNVIISSQPAGAKPPPIGVEFWGTGSMGTNSLVEGNFANGYTWGYGGGNWQINNNTICGPNYTSLGGYISNQQGMSNPPSQSANVMGPTCSSRPSTTPTIVPQGSSFSGQQLITLTSTGANTSIWYTLDGSTPIPGKSTLYIAPITLTQTTTIKAVGMWGNDIQPVSYPAGYGYVPSAVVSATFTEAGLPATFTCTQTATPGNYNCK